MSCGTSGPSTRASPARTIVARMHPQMLAVGDEVLVLHAALVLDDDRPLAAALLLADLDLAVDLGHDRRILGLAGLEDLGDPRQTAGDVLRAARLTGRLGQHMAGLDLSPGATSM